MVSPATGVSGMSMARQVDFWMRSVASKRKSSGVSCTPLARLMKCPGLTFRVACSQLKRLQKPWRARDMDLSFPRTLHHLVTQSCLVAVLSRTCGCSLSCHWSKVLVRSAEVLVSAKNSRGLFYELIGNTKGMATGGTFQAKWERPKPVLGRWLRPGLPSSNHYWCQFCSRRLDQQRVWLGGSLIASRIGCVLIVWYLRVPMEVCWNLHLTRYSPS